MRREKAETDPVKKKAAETTQDKEALFKGYLDRLYETFDLDFLATDPLEFVHRFDRPEDREIVGLISSSLAYGRVAGIKRSIERVMAVVGNSPYRFTMGFSPERDSGLFSDFVHRFNRGPDISALIYFARQMIEDSGSIGGFFLKGYSPVHKNIKEALCAFSENALSLDSAPVYKRKKLPEKAGVRFFFPSPADGSPCKRLNLYLRWMVRRGDRLDFGQWKGVDTSKLVIPLDTHIARISKNIGLTGKTNPDWKMAEEITDGLKRLDPADPVKYDFALCRLGILDRCSRKVSAENCESCMIREICVL
ncbi:MAG: TIGR02757 family protein [Deltaproteobacteria bacterium]|nr:TIGR02757 family protein [Deltaproteobacteria bacterium]